MYAFAALKLTFASPFQAKASKPPAVSQPELTFMIKVCANSERRSRSRCSMQAIHSAPAGIAKLIGKRAEYAVRLCAEAIQAGSLKVPPSVKSYFSKNAGLLRFCGVLM